MRNIIAIAERELKAYFTSPIAYVVLTIFILICGVFFSFFVTVLSEQASIRAITSAQSGQLPDPIDMPGLIAQNLFNTIGFLMLLLAPIMTMSLFSEEKRRGTIELLLTAPITDAQVVLGKFLAAGLFYVVLLLTTVVDIGILYYFSDPASGPIFSAYLGIFLYGLAVLALGMFISTLTENQIIAAVLTFGVVLILWLIDVFSRSVTTPALKAVLTYLSILEHLSDFMAGVVSTSHIIFYLSLILAGLFLTYRSLDSLRWRG